MDTKHHVRIVGTKIIQFRSKQTGEPGEIRLAQCVVTSHTQERGEQVIVGELMLPKHLADTPNGEYVAEFELTVDRDLRIGAKVVALHPVGSSVARPGSPAAQAKDQDKKAA